MNSINNTNLDESLISMYSDAFREGGSDFIGSSFFDRIIQLEIMNDLIQVCPNVENSSINADRTSHDKRRRVDIQKLNGDEAANAADVTDSHMNFSAVLKVRTLHISSVILSGKSKFFYKLFSNGMKESQQRRITLRIAESEEAPFMELLNFMYYGSLNATSPPSLLDVLMAADKFEVPTCMRYCSRVLLNIPMTPESALLYLELPLSVRMTDVVRSLGIAAQQYFIARYKDITKHEEELMGLPIAPVMALLSSNELEVRSEDVVYDFVLMWAQTQYPRREERRKILREMLVHFIRFPHMTCHKLKKVHACNDFHHKVTSKLVSDALYFKTETPYRQRRLAAESAFTSRLFIERSYMYRPVKVVEFEHPYQQCVVYLDLKREECANLFPSGRIRSQAFHFGGEWFFLSAQCNMDEKSFYHCFGFFLAMQEKNSATFTIDFEFSARSKPTLEYIRKSKESYIFIGGRSVGYTNLFGTPWTSLMADDSLLFINGILHLRAVMTIQNQLNLQ